MKSPIFQPFITTLSNGLRFVHLPSGSAAGWCGVAIDTGSRDETEAQHGLAHFVEHTIFKGTTRRRAHHILNRMETVGGELNAYTTKEGTMLFSVFPVQYLERAMELLADLVTNASFPDREIIREMEVVAEEVASYRDSPADAVFDDFEDMVFDGHPLGHNILGNEECLRRFTADDCRRYIAERYTPENMVLFTSASHRPDRVARLAEKHFGNLRRTLMRPDRPLPPTLAPQRQEVAMHLHQAHTVMGARAAAMHDERRFAFALLNNILGGPGMNSLLNVALRERRGLVYTVESSISSFTDCALLQIYYGCDHEKREAAERVTSHIITSLAEQRLSERQLAAYKRQYCGQLLVGGENAENRVLSAAKAMLRYDRIFTLDYAVERVNAITAEQLREAALAVTPDKMSMLTFV